MTTAQSELRRAVSGAMPRLAHISDVVAARPRGPRKWSRKEMVGHSHLEHHIAQMFE